MKRSSNFRWFRGRKFCIPSRDGGEKKERFFGRNAKSHAKSGRPSCQVVARDAPDFDHEGRPLSLISQRIGDIDTDIYESADDNWRENFEMLKQVASEEAF